MNKISFFIIKTLSLILYKEAFSKKEIQNFKKSNQQTEGFIFSVFDYSDKKVKKLIRYLKRKQDPILKKELSHYLYKEIQDYIFDQNFFSYFKNPIIIPVPTTKKQRKRRGFNQTDLLAYFLSEKNKNFIYRKNIIKKQKETNKQALIKNRSERFKNIKNAFCINKKQKELLKNQDVIIVDDLTTTGATLLEIKKLLEKNGVHKIIAVTLAH